MPQEILIEELTSAGFQVVKVLDDWPNHSYCVVFRRPAPEEQLNGSRMGPISMLT
jgi:hypothetical protein